MMKRETADSLSALFDKCNAELGAPLAESAGRSPDSAEALWRLHVAGVLGTIISSVLVPAWRAHPDVSPAGGLTQEQRAYVLPPEEAARRKQAVARARAHIEDVLAQGDESDELRDGLAHVQKRLADLEEYLDHIAAIE